MNRPFDPTSSNHSTQAEPDTHLDRAIAEVRSEPLDEAALSAAAGRVWNRLRAETSDSSAATFAHSTSASTSGASAMNSTPTIPAIQGCAGFQALLPALLQGALSDSRRLLVEDHTRECVACRRALEQLRRGTVTTAASDSQAAGGRRGQGMRRFALAAGLAGLVLVSAGIVSRFTGATVSADVESIAGELWRIDDSRQGNAQAQGKAGTAIVAGTRLGAGDVVRTASGSGAVIRLADGSRVELAERSELRFERRGGHVGLDLVQGALIVDASSGGDGRRGLVVETGEFEATTDAGLYAVRQGTKGARLSVLRGEARLRGGREQRLQDTQTASRAGGPRAVPAVLRSGEQFTSRAELARVPLSREIAWSRQAARYRREIEALRTVGREIDAALAAPARRSTRLLDVVPASTAVYVAVPNVSTSISEAWERLRARVAETPSLAAWFGTHLDGKELAEIEALIDELRDFGGELGQEIVVAIDPDASRAGVVALAEVPRASSFGPRLDEAIVRWNERASREGGPRLRRVDGPVAAGQEEILVWLHGDVLVASPDSTRLAAIDAALRGGGSAFTETSFHSRLVSVYEEGEGAGWVAGIDAQRLVASHHAADATDPSATVPAETGWEDLQHVILNATTAEPGSDGGGTTTRALFAFHGERQGMAAWLAAPAPLGAIDFISPDAHLAFAGLVEDPAKMLDDALRVAISHNPGAADELAQFEQQIGIALRRDLAETLGGEVAFALDGPVLPQPSWKLVVEVLDPSRLQQTIEAAVEAINRSPEREGRRLELAQESSGGRIVYQLVDRRADGTPSGPVVHYLFESGYLLAGPNRALLLDAIAQRHAGVTLASSASFTALLPEDGEAHFSAMAYQNLGGAMGPFASWLGGLDGNSQLTEEQRAEIQKLVGQVGAGLALAYGGTDRITLAARSTEGPFGVSMERLLSLGGVLQGGQMLQPSGSRHEPATGAPAAPRPRPVVGTRQGIAA